MTNDKRYGKAAEIEAMLIARMEERFRDGDVAEEIVGFFEMQGHESEIPLWIAGKERKQRTLRRPKGDGASDADRGSSHDTRGTSLVPPTNRNPTFHENPQNRNNCPHIMGGYDGGVEVGFSGTWVLETRRETMDLLEAAKTAALDEDNPVTEFELDGVMYVMSPKTARVGRCQYKYVFEGNGVKFYVHSNPKGKTQPIRVRYDATGLIGRDLFFKHADTLEFLVNIGFVVESEKLSRVDMQVMIECRIEDLLDPGKECRNRIVCSAQNYAFYGKGLSNPIQTFLMGNISVLQICIYDKRAKMFRLMTKDPIKYRLMIDNCFGEDFVYEETPVTRIEFRMGCCLVFVTT